MKVTKSQLKRIIKEELKAIMEALSPEDQALRAKVGFPPNWKPPESIKRARETPPRSEWDKAEWTDQNQKDWEYCLNQEEYWDQLRCPELQKKKELYGKD